MQLYRDVENVRPLPGDEEYRDLGFRPPTLRELWRALNAPRGVDGVAVRYASLTMLVFYVIAIFVRPAPSPLAIWVRSALCIYIGIAVVFGPRFTWRALRLYTVGLALTLNFATGSVVLMRDPVPGDLAVLAMTMFAPMVFLQTAVDVLIAGAILGASAILVVAFAVPAGASVSLLVLFGALVTGALTALVLILFRDRVSVSTTWWQDACTRERALREFAEGAAPQLGETVVARELAARLRHTFGTGHCAIVVPDAHGAPRTLATAGLWQGSEPDADALNRLLAALADRNPLVQVGEVDTALPWASPGGTLVALPIVLDDVVSGAIVLSAIHSGRSARKSGCSGAPWRRRCARRSIRRACSRACRRRCERAVGVHQHHVARAALAAARDPRLQPRCSPTAAGAAGRRRAHARQRPRVAAVAREHARRGAPRGRQDAPCSRASSAAASSSTSCARASAPARSGDHGVRCGG